MNHISKFNCVLNFANFFSVTGRDVQMRLGRTDWLPGWLECRVAVKCIPVSAKTKTLSKPIELPVGEIIRMEYNSAASSYEAMLSR